MTMQSLCIYLYQHDPSMMTERSEKDASASWHDQHDPMKIGGSLSRIWRFLKKSSLATPSPPFEGVAFCSVYI